MKRLYANPLATLHRRLVFGRRVRVLANELAATLPPYPTVLDVGCGDGAIDLLIHRQRPELQIRGVDVLPRPEALIPVEPFDGDRLPAADAGYDTVMLVDVLHHTLDPTVLLREAKRVARHAVLVKDHTMDGPLAGARLRLMDWVGNAPHGVALPYNYWPERRWRASFAELGLGIADWRTEIPLYPFPASAVFGRGLHFIARLTKR